MTSPSATERSTAWLVRLHAGDENTLREIMEAYFDDVAAFALQYVRSPDVARDVAQETFIRCWDRRHRLTVDTPLRAYLFRVARNRAPDVLRQDARATNLELQVMAEYAASARPATNDDVARVAEDEFRALVREVAATLTPRVREVLLLYFEQALDPTEIARVLGTAPVRCTTSSERDYSCTSELWRAAGRSNIIALYRSFHEPLHSR